jgi:hypothetical protein
LISSSSTKNFFNNLKVIFSQLISCFYLTINSHFFQFTQVNSEKGVKSMKNYFPIAPNWTKRKCLASVRLFLSILPQWIVRKHLMEATHFFSDSLKWIIRKHLVISKKKFTKSLKWIWGRFLVAAKCFRWKHTIVITNLFFKTMQLSTSTKPILKEVFIN